MPAAQINFRDRLAISKLSELADELHMLREHPPLTFKGNGYYEGGILGFVKGLRISARLIYCLREWLSTQHCSISWGHVLHDGESCSPECDVIIHKPGYIRKWNGSDAPIMEFVFVDSEDVIAVISCKSLITSIEDDYPNRLNKYGVKNVFLFGESCSQTNYTNLRQKAKDCGYGGLWCSYFSTTTDSFIRNEEQFVEFREEMLNLFKESYAS